MAKLLRRQVGTGKLLRVPVGLWYPNPGKLHRGCEIDPPDWEIGEYADWDGCIAVLDQTSSVYTPKYATVQFSGLTDCPGCDKGHAARLAGWGKMLLTQQASPADTNLWYLEFSDAVDWRISLSQVGPNPPYGIRPQVAAYTLTGTPKTRPFVNIQGDPDDADFRLGVTIDNLYVVGDCCGYDGALQRVCYGGQAQVWPGDQR